MVRHEYAVRVRYAETDQMGFAYHGNYFAWFEAARVDLLDALGVPYRELEAEGFYLPVVEAGVRYRQSATFDDRLRVIASIEELPRLRIRISYEIKRGETLICTAFTQHAFIDKAGELQRPPKHFLKVLEARFQCDVS